MARIDTTIDLERLTVECGRWAAERIEADLPVLTLLRWNLKVLPHADTDGYFPTELTKPVAAGGRTLRA